MKDNLAITLALFALIYLVAINTYADDSSIQSVNNGSENTQAMLEYYTVQSVYTDPGEHLAIYDDLPDDTASIVKAVQGVLIHGGLTWLYELSPSEEQNGGFNIRKTEKLLERIKLLDNAPLVIHRPKEKRLIVNCRQFAILTCSILRHKKMPARVRAGYATYTWGRGKYENHWICEYYSQSEKKWIQVDAQIDQPQRKLMKIDFDTLHMPQGKFIAAGEGWQLYRSGIQPPENFGLGGKEGWNAIGLEMLTGNVTCDTMALNKAELLPWDVNPYWNKSKDELTDADIALLDELADLTVQVNNKWLTLKSAYEKNIDTLLAPTAENIMPQNDQPVLLADLSPEQPNDFGAALMNHPLIHPAPGEGPNGSDAIRVDYVGYEQGSKRVVVRHKLPVTGNEMTLCYYVQFEDDFQFVRGGKLHGLGPDKPVTGGAPTRPDGWSSRVMFHKDGTLATYLYTQDKTIKWGVGEYAEGFNFKNSQWHAVSIHVRVNSAPDTHDGFTHVYVDGRQVIQHDDVQFRGSTEPGTEITQVLFSTFHGGNTTDWTPVDEQGNPVTCHALFSGIAVYQGLHVLQ